MILVAKSRETVYPLQKSELFYFDEKTGTSKPFLMSKDGKLQVEAQFDASGLSIGSVDSKNVNVDFQDEATTTGVGTTFEVGSYKNLRIEIWGTSESRKVEFFGLGVSGTKRPIIGVRSLDLEMATSTTGNNEFWEFYIEGLEEVIMEVTAISGGNINIKGKAVS